MGQVVARLRPKFERGLAVADTVPARFSFTIVDELGVEASIQAYLLVDPLCTAADLSAGWQTMATAIDGITGGQITRGQAVVVEAMTGGKGSPAAGSRVEQTGVFDYGTAVGTHVWGQAIASLADSVISGGKINLANANVIAYQAVIPGTITLGEYANSSFQALTTFKDCFISFRKRRKQLDRASKEV